MAPHAPSPIASGNHFSCSLTAVLLARVHAFGGDEAVQQLLELAGSQRTPDYLRDLANWVSYEEVLALWKAGAQVTHHPQFAHAVGTEAARRLNASPVAALLRSLGSPEAVYRQIATTATKFSTVTRLDAVDVGPGFAEIVAVAVNGFPRAEDHCRWTTGLLSQTTILFGLAPANVEHEECEAFGAPLCRYRVTWDAEEAQSGAESSELLGALRQQLEAMKERLHSMFVTASDLIDASEIEDVLARITDRAAIEVRAPRYLLAVRTPDGEVHCHHKGFAEGEAASYAETILEKHPASLPPSWLVVPVRSNRQDYGRLMAMYEPGGGFFPQERELFEVYARYAATALDGATALMEAKKRYEQSSALLDLARALAAAGTSGEVARRLADAVPVVVDCDRVAVYLWDVGREALVRRAVGRPGGVRDETDGEERIYSPRPGGPLAEWLKNPQTEPIFVDAETGNPVLREIAARNDSVASILVPLATQDSLLGLLAVSVTSDKERLTPSPDLLDRLSGVAAQATTALQNGRLVDQITHQALHDQLTGLPNRLQFTDKLRTAIHHARKRREAVTLFYVDLDGFKPVNDEFGHETGDELLVAVGDRLAACTRGTDTVARLGGDEFVVLLDGDGGNTDAIEERLAGAFKTPFRFGGHNLQLGASMGRASFPADADDAESLLRVADAKMFEAKRERQGQLLAPARRR